MSGEQNRELPDWLDGYMYYTEDTEPPLLYRKWMGVSSIAACLQRRCRVEVGFLRFYPNFYVVLVGPSGKCRKGGAMAPALQLLREAGIKLVADSITREQLVSRLKAASDTEVNKETGEVVMHASLTTCSTELGVFLGDYNERFLWDLIDWYDCKDHWEYETKHQGKFHIDGVWFNLIAATTPKVLQERLSMVSTSGGLTSRMIFVNEFDRDKNLPEPLLSPAQVEVGLKLINDMERLKNMYGLFKRTDECREAYNSWYEWIREHPPFQDSRFNDYFERRGTHVIKLCMIMSASRSSSMIIEKSDFDRALELLISTERKMPYTYSGVGKSELVAATDAVLQTLQTRKTISLAELLTLHYHDISANTLQDVISQLEIMKKVKRTIDPQKSTSTIEWIGEEDGKVGTL